MAGSVCLDGGLRAGDGGGECKMSGNEGQRKRSKFREQTETPLSLSKPKQR